MWEAMPAVMGPCCGGADEKKSPGVPGRDPPRRRRMLSERCIWVAKVESSAAAWAAQSLQSAAGMSQR